MLIKKIAPASNCSAKEEKSEQDTKRDVSVFKGLFLGALSGLFFATTALLVKYLHNLSTEQLTLYRFIGIYFLSLPEAVRYRGNIFAPKQYRLTIFIRSIFATVYILLSYTTFRLLPLGEASVIVLSYPALVAIFSRIFLKEPCGVIQVMILILTIIGVGFIAKLPAIVEGKTNIYTKETTIGLLTGIASVVINTSQIIIVRSLKNVHHVVVMFNLGWIAIIETAVIIAFKGNLRWHDCGIQGLLIILLAIFNYISQILITIALQGEHAGPVAIMRAGADILLSFIFQTFIYNDIPDKYSIIGAIILGVAFLLSGIQKWISSLSCDSPKLKQLKRIL